MKPASDLTAVLALAARGWRLHPCQPKSKQAIIRDWPTLATTDPGQIRAWHAQHPACNWALACGPGSGVWAMDVDVKPCQFCPPDTRKVDGKTTLRNLIEQHGPLPKTLATVTCHGGQYLFKYPTSRTIRNENAGKKLGDGVDIRGDGGYIVVPPSIHPEGAAYRFAAPDAPVVDAPNWLVEMVASLTPHVSATADERIPRGKGEPMKFELAWKMFKAGATQEEVFYAVSARDKNCIHQEGEAKIRQRVADWHKRCTAGESPAGPRRAEIVTLATVEPKDVEWLWQPYLPAGMLALLSGDPGAGKTFIALAIAAALTTGHVPYSHERCPPVDVLYLSTENDPARVVRPRFDATGGDAARLHMVTGTVAGDGAEAQRDAIWLTDTAALSGALAKTHARLLIVDPIQSYLGAKVDAHRANETRPVLDGLARLAEKYSCCVLLLRHLSKARGGRAIHAGLGSIDLTGAARTEMLAGSSADDAQQWAMVQIKSNVGVYGPALGYTVDETGFSWTGESKLTQSDILAPESAERESAVAEASEWLRNYLAAGPRTAKEVAGAARAAGLAWRTVNRAKNDAGVKSRKPNYGDGWVWVIAQECQAAPKDANFATTEELASLDDVDIPGAPKAITGEL